MIARIKFFVTVFLATAILLVTFAIFLQSASADSPTPTPSGDASQTSNIGDCQSQHISVADCPNYYKNKLSEAQGQEHTLTSQIAVMDSQINLTQAQIVEKQYQIVQLTSDIHTTSTKIATIEGSLNGLTQVLLDHIVATYKVGQNQDFSILVSSSTISDFFQRANYLRIVQAHDKQLIYDTVQTKNDYANQQNIFVAKKKQVEALNAQLQAYTVQLNQEKASKQQLLTQTQGDEATYQRLLLAAQAQLAGFSSFVTAQGGASILSNQTVCDSWGCYYNQRDSQWGNIGINQSATSIAEAGCLMTSMAMVLSHYGHKVTPLDIDNPGNFFSSTAYLLKTISAGGVTATRISSAIDSVLNDGNNDPVIVGISYDGGPIADHFVVLVSGSNGNYIMNDPFVPSGHNISFTSHYSVASIVEIERVSL